MTTTVGGVVGVFAGTVEVVGVFVEFGFDGSITTGGVGFVSFFVGMVAFAGSGSGMVAFAGSGSGIIQVI